MNHHDESEKKRPAPLFPHVWFAVDCVPDVMKWKVVGFHTKGQQPNNPLIPETTPNRKIMSDHNESKAGPTPPNKGAGGGRRPSACSRLPLTRWSANTFDRADMLRSAQQRAAKGIEPVADIVEMRHIIALAVEAHDCMSMLAGGEVLEAGELAMGVRDIARYAERHGYDPENG